MSRIKDEDWRRACKKHDTLYTVCVIDPVIRIFFPAILKSGVTPNQVTLLNFFNCMIISALFLSGHGMIAGFWFISWYWIDCIDGKIARYREQASYFGSWLDQTTDHIGMGFIFLAEGYYLQSQGADYGVLIGLGFYSLWLLTLTNDLHLNRIRPILDPGSSDSKSSQNKEENKEESFFARWKRITGERRIIATLVHDVENLHVAVALGGIFAEIRFVLLATAIMVLQKSVSSMIFWKKRWHLVTQNAN